MKVIGIYDNKTKEQYLKMKNYLSLCVVGIAVDVEIFVSPIDKEKYLEKYNVKSLPAFVVVDSLINPISAVDNGSIQELEEIAVTSGKRLKV